MSQIRSIVQINTRDRRGGAERVAWNLFQAYQERGRASWLVVGKKYSNDPHVWEIANAPHATTHWARTWLRWSEAFSPWRRRGVKGMGVLQERLRLVAQPAARGQRRQGYEDFAYPGTGECRGAQANGPCCGRLCQTALWLAAAGRSVISLV